MTRGFDVVVVGGGPAGSATATRLAGAGCRVLVLDRAHFPRPKPCGECLSPAAVAALARLGVLDRVRQAPHATIEGWRIQPAAGPGFAGDFPGDAPGIAISREALDSILLDHARDAGAEVRTGVRVSDLVIREGAVVGVRTAEGDATGIATRLVVGADGLRSVVVRRLGLLARRPRLRKLALTAHVRGAEDLRGRGELRLFRGGCLGMADIGGGRANVTVVLGDPLPRGVSGAREAYFDGVIRSHEGLAGASRDGAVLATGPFDWPSRSAIADGALLVGDAAGYYDPFTGQGIYRALRGAELAAAAAVEALRHGEITEASLRPYELARRREFSSGERLQHVIEFFISRPRLLERVARRLATRPSVTDALIGVTGDLEPVRTLLAPRNLAALIA